MKVPTSTTIYTTTYTTPFFFITIFHIYIHLIGYRSIPYSLPDLLEVPSSPDYDNTIFSYLDDHTFPPNATSIHGPAPHRELLMAFTNARLRNNTSAFVPDNFTTHHSTAPQPRRTLFSFLHQLVCCFLAPTRAFHS